MRRQIQRQNCWKHQDLWSGRERKVRKGEGEGELTREAGENGAFLIFQPTELITHYFLRITDAFLFLSLYV